MQRMAKGKGGDDLLTYSLERVLGRAGPREAEVLRRCALVRSFDVGVLAVLRGKVEGNERVLEMLRGYSFVREVGPGRLAYHDQVRRALLAEWVTQRPAEMDGLHQRLAAYFAERLSASRAERQAKTAPAASQTWSAHPAGDWEMWRREAIYHLLWADPGQGMERLRAAFAELEAGHRLADAETLLQVAVEPPLAEADRRWLHYLRARAQRAALRLAEAEEQLEALLRLPDLAPELAAQARRSLGEVYVETNQWALATSLYRESLAYFEAQGNQPAVADTWLLLGDAYLGLGISTGGWHAPFRARHPLLRALAYGWAWLLGLPFVLLALLMQRPDRRPPRARYCAYYQNWLLIRLYNTARRCYLEARRAFAVHTDELGLLRIDQRLADLLLRYGYRAEAQRQVEALLKRPAAQDRYRRAWLQRSLAECRLAAGDTAGASALLAEALVVFREVGDVRREAAVLALQGRVATHAGDIAGALASYRSSLAQFRALRYAAAREQILSNLRIWRRSVAEETPVGREIGALIAAEPEKRYVGRFLSGYLPLLQIAALVALPLTLLLLAYVVPTSIVQTVAGGVLSLETFYSPWRGLGALALLVTLYLAAYTALALSVIFFLPITRIEREQPDVLITTPADITRYDSFGTPVQRMPWVEVRNWLSLDRCTWNRPLPLYSRTFLEDAAGEDLRIDGITGWYADTQQDIAARLAAAGNTRAQRRDLGYSLLRSKNGAAAVLGALLLLVWIGSENRWLGLYALLPPEVYAVIYLVAFSGILLLVPAAYWMATRPLQLQRELELDERWPLVTAAMGALPIAAYLQGGGALLPIGILNASTFLWGVYMLVESLAALALPRRHRLRPALLAAALLAGLVAVWPQVYTIYHLHISRIHSQRAELAAPDNALAEAQQGYAAAGNVLTTGEQVYTAAMSQGRNAAVAGDFATAVQAYGLAASAAPDGSPRQALAAYNLAWAYWEAGDRRSAALAYAQYRAICGRSSDEICRAIDAEDHLNLPL